MVGEDCQRYTVAYGQTDGVNLPYMPEGKFFGVGYNDKFGLVLVLDGEYSGEPEGFEGRVNIESLLRDSTDELGSKELADVVEAHIMDAYHNLINHRLDPESDPVVPMLEVLSDRYSVPVK